MRIAFVDVNNTLSVSRGAGSVASSIIAAGHELHWFSTAIAPPTAIINAIVMGRFDYLMVSSMTMLLQVAVELIAAIGKLSPITSILGGIGITAQPEAVNGRMKGAPDYIVIGEGESTIIDFLNADDREAVTNIPNIGWPAEDLAKLPPFEFGLFPKEIVVQNGAATVTATRGCPYNCLYCCNSIYLRMYGKNYVRSRPVDDVINEMKTLTSFYDAEFFYFADEMALANPIYAEKLFTAIKEKVNLQYGVMARVEHVDEKTVALLKDTGCTYIGMGIECGDEGYRRKALNRTMSNEKIKEAFRLTKEAGLFRTSYNMIGYPTPNDERITQTTVRLNKEIQPDYAQFTIFYPLPGTRLYDTCVDEDLIDVNKLKETYSYYQDSVLKDVSVKSKQEELHGLFNPNGNRFRTKNQV